MPKSIIASGLRLTRRKPKPPTCERCDERIPDDDPRGPLDDTLHLGCWDATCEEEGMCPRCGNRIDRRWSMCADCALEVA